MHIKTFSVVLVILALAVFVGHNLFGIGKPASPPGMWEDPEFAASVAAWTPRGAAGVAVVAPASGIRGDSPRKAREIAEKLGVAFPGEMLDAEAVPYNANTDGIRIELLKKALADPDIDVLWALRGGYGSGRLLAALAESPVPKKPKVFVGYSDMTFLHLFFQRLGWRTVHGAMFWETNADAESKDPENFRRLSALLSQRGGELRYDGVKAFNQAAREAGAAIEGPMTGGNLTCVAAAVGTPWGPDAKDGILFLEDVQEQGYKIDRMLTQLRAAGVLDEARAVLFGSFSRGDEHTEYALERFAREFDKPVFRSDRFGHGRQNHPLVLNCPASIDKASEGEDTFTLRIAVDRLP